MWVWSLSWLRYNVNIESLTRTPCWWTHAALESIRPFRCCQFRPCRFSSALHLSPRRLWFTQYHDWNMLNRVNYFNITTCLSQKKSRRSIFHAKEPFCEIKCSTWCRLFSGWLLCQPIMWQLLVLAVNRCHSWLKHRYTEMQTRTYFHLHNCEWSKSQFRDVHTTKT